MRRSRDRMAAKRSRGSCTVMTQVPPLDVSRQACVVGIGTSSQFGLTLDRQPLSLQVEAFRCALADAGLDKRAVDGMASAQAAPRGVDYEEFVIGAGLDLRWVSQAWTHGRWA